MAEDSCCCHNQGGGYWHLVAEARCSSHRPLHRTGRVQDAIVGFSLWGEKPCSGPSGDEATSRLARPYPQAGKRPWPSPRQPAGRLVGEDVGLRMGL